MPRLPGISCVGMQKTTEEVEEEQNTSCLKCGLQVLVVGVNRCETGDIGSEERAVQAAENGVTTGDVPSLAGHRMRA